MPPNKDRIRVLTMPIQTVNDLNMELRRFEVKSGDVVCLECDKYLRGEVHEYLQERMEKLFPDNKCVVLEGGLRLTVYGSEAEIKSQIKIQVKDESENKKGSGNRS